MLGFSALSVGPLSTSTRNNVATQVTSPFLNFVANSIAAQGKNNSASNSVSATLSAGTLSTNLVANILTNAVTANTSANTTSIKLSASKVISATSATFSLGDLEFPPDDVLLDAISLSVGITELDFNAKASTTTSSVSLLSSLFDITTLLEISASAEIGTLSSTFSLNLDKPADNLFDYGAHAEDYARTRTVYILPEGGYNLSKVIHVNPENFTLTIDAHRDIPTTVLITQ